MRARLILHAKEFNFLDWKHILQLKLNIITRRWRFKVLIISKYLRFSGFLFV
jgi:hypothetical protein